MAQTSGILTKKAFDFSIESILRNGGSEEKSRVGSQGVSQLKEEVTSSSEYSPEFNEGSSFSWLNCTRFKPPKLPRSKKRCNSSTKRFGRGPRIPFSPHQIGILEHTFGNSQYLSSDNILGLAKALHLTETRVKIWFQNRRARYRREKDNSGSLETLGSNQPKVNEEGLRIPLGEELRDSGGLGSCWKDSGVPSSFVLDFKDSSDSSRVFMEYLRRSNNTFSAIQQHRMMSYCPGLSSGGHSSHESLVIPTLFPHNTPLAFPFNSPS